MIAYKAFNKNLQATMGKGTFQFEEGKTYEETSAKCANTGFHCAENPLCTLDYYSGMDTRFFVVEAEGDINQDGYNSRISCTKITLKKEISRLSIATRGVLYLENYPLREENCSYVKREEGSCGRKGDFIIVRGKDPVARGVKGSYLFLLKENRNNRRIKEICTIFIDGKEYKENTDYGIRKGEACEKVS